MIKKCANKSCIKKIKHDYNDDCWPSWYCSEKCMLIGEIKPKAIPLRAYGIDAA